MYRFRDGQWKERGSGGLKLLRDRKTRQIRLLMRQDKTLKVIANHFLSEKPYCELIPMAASDKAFVWLANDYSENEGANEKLAVKFSTVDCTPPHHAIVATKFKENFNKAREFNKYLKAGDEAKLVMAPVIEEEPEVKKEDKKEQKEEEQGGDKEGEKKEIEKDEKKCTEKNEKKEEK
eukprot:TRINITY_DN10426_c0_g3_i1.p2 TRINITY_DN10426_c0_g3~~TRINITY_DN10426_c0_g3_i1.p2  ORF type:complete len:178 (-),score=89.03 TRINITY_DN10426_c0_g3_i1:107-640(-)